LFDKSKKSEDEDELMDIDEEDLKDAIHFDLSECLDGLRFVVSG
jgi:hypothetical protein